MASSVGIITGTASVKSGVTCMARLLGNLGTPVTFESLSAIAFNVQALTVNPIASTGSGTLVPSAVVFDSLQQNDARWDRDSASFPGPDGQWGYNFLTPVNHSYFTAFDTLTDPLSGLPILKPHKFQIDFTFTPLIGEPFVVSYQVNPSPTWP